MSKLLIGFSILFLFLLVIPGQSIIIQGAVKEKLTNPIDIIKSVAIRKGIKPEHLLAISYHESNLGKYQTGDHGISHGYFHINTKANPDAAAIIGNIEEEANWVCDKLISYGYKEGYITLSFAKYNAPAYPNFKYAEAVKSKILLVANL